MYLINLFNSVPLRDKGELTIQALNGTLSINPLFLVS